MDIPKPRNPVVDTIAACLLNFLAAFFGSVLAVIVTHRAFWKASAKASAKEIPSLIETIRILFF
jgi:hypothetical protein